MLSDDNILSQYSIILAHLSIYNGYLPSSQYMAKFQVDRFTVKALLQNFRCILSISFDLENPKIWLEKT